MKVLRISQEHPDEKKLVLAADALKTGKILVYPTDTVYGIGCAPDSENVEKVFEIKRRPRNNPLSIACSSLQMAEEYAEFSREDRDYIRKNLAGPYTFIAPKKENIPDSVTAGKKTVGVRIPDHPVLQKILEYAKKPVITTSANFSGEPAPASFDEIREEIISAADVAVDSGRCKVGKPSSVIDLATKKIIR